MELNEKLNAKLAELEAKFGQEASLISDDRDARSCNNCDGHCQNSGYAD
ncbi:MAG: hypothetical protein SNI49_07570 [Rikenellaceae bacterium]